MSAPRNPSVTAFGSDSDDDAPPEVLGLVAAPPNKESTSDEFYFWVRRGAVVEKTQVVRSECALGGLTVRFYGLVREVFRQGRPRSMAEAHDGADGDVDYEPPFVIPGVTYASVTILRTEPAVLAPPLEGSKVVLGGADEAAVAYAADEIEPAKRLALGLIKNGGTRYAGPGCIDLDYLLGVNGGHLNVNGVAGRGTKSSFLLHVIALLLIKSEREKREKPSDSNRLRVVPIILNVKNYDLFHIDRPSAQFDPEKHDADWRALGVENPRPFQNVTFLAPQLKGLDTPVSTGRHGPVTPYSWSLSDVIEGGLFSFLFAEDDVRDDNFGGLVLDVQSRLTREANRSDGEDSPTLNDQDGAAATFDGLVHWVDALFDDKAFSTKHHSGTRNKFRRRLFKIVHEGNGVLRRSDRKGHPLQVTAQDSAPPIVIDLASLARTPALQRFVVAAIFQQLVEDRTGARGRPGLKYLVMLDELNRFAPRGSDDPITRLIETVAAEMRSQGIILLGAQQQASLVSTRVIENAGIKAVGKSGSMELGKEVWRFLGDAARRKAEALLPAEKLLVQDSFREPMLVKVPFPPWALNPDEARAEAPSSDPDNIDSP